MGVARDPRLDAIQQLLAIIRLLRLEPRPGCTKRAEPSSHCPTCPPLFPRWSARAGRFDLSRQPSSEDVSASIVRGLAHVGFDTSLFTGISARRRGLSTAIEAGAEASLPPSRPVCRRPFSGCTRGMLVMSAHGASAALRLSAQPQAPLPHLGGVPPLTRSPPPRSPEADVFLVPSSPLLLLVRRARRARPPGPGQHRGPAGSSFPL